MIETLPGYDEWKLRYPDWYDHELDELDEEMSTMLRGDWEEESDSPVRCTSLGEPRDTL